MEAQILRRRQVVTICGISPATIYRWIANGTFPAPVRLGSHRVGWRKADIEAWLESRPQTA